MSDFNHLSEQGPKRALLGSALRRRAVMTIAVLLAAMSISTLTTGAAQAAAPQSGLTGCFNFAKGGAPWTNATYLQLWNGSSWVDLGKKAASVDGCVTFTINNANSQYFRIRAYERVYNTWDGATGYTTVKNGQYLTFTSRYLVYQY